MTVRRLLGVWQALAFLAALAGSWWALPSGRFDGRSLVALLLWVLFIRLVVIGDADA